MLKLYWYLTAFLRKHGLVVVFSIIAAVVVFSIFIPVIARQLEAKPKTYIGMVGSYTLQTLPIEIQQQISSGLTKTATDGSVNPDLALRWTVEDDGRTYRFIIRDDARWQDGTPLKPQDINYTFADVETITTQNDVVFKLPDKYVPFPTNVTQPLFRVETEPWLIFFRRKKLIGLDEFRVVKMVEQGQQLKEIVLEGPQERLIYRFYLTERDAITAFKLGQVDVLLDLTNPYELTEWPNVNVVATSRPDRYLAVFFDNNHPLFTKNVRQALSYALKKPSDSTRAIGPINPNSWAYLPSGKTYDFDLERANERVLAEIPTQPLTFELTTTPAFEAEAESIKSQWQEFSSQAIEACQKSSDIKDKNQCQNLRLDVTIRITNFPDTNNFQALLVGQEAPADPDQYALWHSEQTTNFSHYKNTRIDKLLEEGRQVADKQKRLEIYQEFQQFFLEDAPATFLHHLVSYDVSR